jgi:SNF2 family DNA or RNA helicase
MTWANISIKKDSLFVEGNTFDVKDALKRIPGSCWKGTQKAWTFPRSPMSASRLRDVLSTHNIRINGSTGFEKLLSIHERITTIAAAKKDALDLSPIPITKTKPWLHQLRAYHFARELESCMLAMDMGTGKSKVAVDLICNHETEKPVQAIIACPRYVVPVWPRQFDFHAGREVVICAPDHGAVPKRLERIIDEQRRAVALRLPFVGVINYEMTLNENVQNFLVNQEWDFGICDESHRIKAPSGIVSRFIRGMFRRHCKQRLALSGTPMPNNPLDIWAQYYFLDPGIFGTSYHKCRMQYAICDEWGKPVQWMNEREMHDLIYSIAYRVSSDVLDLPEELHIERTCEFEDSAKKIYRDMKNKMIAELDNGVLTAANAGVKLLRLRQITSGHLPKDEENPKDRVEISTAKRDLFAQVIEDLPIHEPIVVFCQFHPDLDNVTKVAQDQGRTTAELSGRMRDQSEHKAWEQGERDVLVAQIDAAREGIDCTRARYAIYYSLGYSPGVYEQSKRRLLRPGQTRNVMYYHLLVENSVDALVYRALEQKKDIIDYILEDLRNERG